MRESSEDTRVFHPNDKKRKVVVHLLQEAKIRHKVNERSITVYPERSSGLIAVGRIVQSLSLDWNFGEMMKEGFKHE